MKKQALYEMFLADPEISHIIKMVPHSKITNQLRSQIYNRMIMICENLTDNKVNLDRVLKRSFYKNSTLWLTGQWVNHFSKSIKQDFLLKRNYFMNKNCNAWESELEGFIVILSKSGYFSYFNALKTAKTLFKRVPGYYYGRNGEKVCCYSHTSTESLVASNMRVMLDSGAALGGNCKNRVPEINPYTGHNFKNSTGLSFVVEKRHKGIDERISITFRHADCRGNANSNVLQSVKDCLTNLLIKMPHVFSINAITAGNEMYIEFSIDTNAENPVTVTSPAELVAPVKVEEEKPVKTTITDEDIRAHLENKIVVLSDEIGVLIQERDNISEQINDRSEKLEKIRKLIEVL